MPPAWVQGPSQAAGQWQAGPRPVAYPSPVRFEGVPGEPFALAILPTPKVLSGTSVGALVAGIGSILVSGAVWCFGLAGASQGWGALVGGAFFVLAALLGLAAVGLGLVGLRGVKRDLTQVSTGKGYAIAGISCGGFGVVSAVLGLGLAIILSQSA
jgi:hypothetical protein